MNKTDLERWVNVSEPPYVTHEGHRITKIFGMHDDEVCITYEYKGDVYFVIEDTNLIFPIQNYQPIIGEFD